MDKRLTPVARRLRGRETEAEKLMWHHLRARQFLDLKWRRQHPVGSHVADFACDALRLIVELDGGQHADSESDRARTAALQSSGWQVQRYWNNDVLDNIEGVLTDLAGVVAAIRR